jgi:hypothetical protein
MTAGTPRQLPTLGRHGEPRLRSRTPSIANCRLTALEQRGDLNPLVAAILFKTRREPVAIVDKSVL